VLFQGRVTESEMNHIHFWEVAQANGKLVTAGIFGQVMVVTGTGADVSAARVEAYRLAARVVVPNLRYRDDIGERLVASELATLIRLGLFQMEDFMT
jgi:phosphoribosylamine---glycine ligase